MERDYRVTYRTREIDPRDDVAYEKSRRRVPTALDPYRYPEDREELKRNVAEVKARNKRYHDDRDRDYDSPSRQGVYRDDLSNSTVKGTVKPETTKTIYSVTSAGIERETETRTAGPVPKAATTIYRQDDDLDYRRPTARGSGRPRNDRDYAPADGGYVRERPPRETGGYVVDMRDADVIDVYTGSGARESERGFAGFRNDPYEGDYRRDYGRNSTYRSSRHREVDRNRGTPSSSASSLQGGGPYMTGARTDRGPVGAASRSQTEFTEAPSRTSTRVYEDELNSQAAAHGPSRTSRRRDEEDWGIIERVSTRDAEPAVRENFRDPIYDKPPEVPRGRVRRSTIASDDYVMVSLPKESAATSTTGPVSIRSAMVRQDSYTPEERLQRRRSRSISFREEEAAGHHRGDKFAERPGAEAAMMGRYLKHYDVDDDRTDRAYSSRSRRDERDERDVARYPPQRVRSHSRRRRGTRANEDDSYDFSYREKTVKDTYY